MSDEEDYSSSEDESSVIGIGSGSVGDEFMTVVRSHPKVLTLEDNDDDANEFQRPDLAPIYAEDDDEEEESEGEMSYDEVDGEGSSTTPSKGGKLRSRRRGVAKFKPAKSSDGKKKTSDDGNKKANTGTTTTAKKKKKKPIGICMIATKYECVRRVAKKLAFKEVDENEDWSLFWTDTSVSIDRVNQMKKWQVRILRRINTREEC